MNENQMQHGTDWNGEDLTGWWLSEKFNGCRAFWDGETLWSRGGIAINIPDDWRVELPAIPLDCEMYDGIDGVYRCGSAIRYGKFTNTMRLKVFDVPNAKGNWNERMKYAANILKGCKFIECVPWRKCLSTEDALNEMDVIQSRGGEGLVVRAPSHKYIIGRFDDMLKVKYHIIKEAI